MARSSEEYREAFGEHAYDDRGQLHRRFDYAATEFTPETEAQAAWAEYVAEHGSPPEGAELPAGVERPAAPAEAPVVEVAAPTPAAEVPVAEVPVEAPSAEASPAPAEG